MSEWLVGTCGVIDWLLSSYVEHKIPFLEGFVQVGRLWLQHSETLWKIDGDAPPRRMITFRPSLCNTLLFLSKTYIEEWRGVLLHSDFDRWFPFSAWTADVILYRFVLNQHQSIQSVSFFSVSLPFKSWFVYRIFDQLELDASLHLESNSNMSQ